MSLGICLLASNNNNGERKAQTTSTWTLIRIWTSMTAITTILVSRVVAVFRHHMQREDATTTVVAVRMMTMRMKTMKRKTSNSSQL